MNPLSRAPLPPSIRAKTVTAVLGPTNTGKTHLAIERMLAHKSGLIGLPLRLLAREVYQKIAARAGADQVALITGEEKIIPPNPRYFVSTVEAMPKETDVDFVAIDEVQLAGDLERGHVFTDRILNLRGRGETLLLGAQTVRGLLEKLLPGLNVVTRPRMSQLTYAGSKKITRLPARSAIVAFSADEVYAIAELIRRQRGGAAVVLGALSPRTRNAQVDLFQSGDVDFLIATDAVGMGLNLDVDHVAFAGNRKFDGYQYRNLSAAELGQIAGRAGRHLRDGTFGVTGRVDPLDDELVQALETHQFAPLKVLQWRNPQLDFSSIDALRRSLDRAPAEEGLAKAPPADDVTALEFAARDGDIAPNAKGEALVTLLWDVCQVPDYRKIAPANHAELVTTLYDFLVRRGTISDDWFARQVAEADKIDGDIDTLSNRIAHIRTWTFIANRPDWLTDPVHWRDKTRAIEDRLSDALHERLTQRFVDRRTSVLMRRLRENAMLEAEITPAGDVVVEGHRVGHLQGFRFQPDTTAEGPDAKAVRNAASKVLATEFEARADKLSRAGAGEIALAADGTLRWLGETVGKLARADDALRPAVLLLADEQLTGPARDKVQARLDQWVKTHVETLLKPLTDLRDAPDLEGIARGVAFQLVEGLGVLERSQIADEIKSLDQPMRAGLRKYGVRFGAYHVFVPLLLKPAPSGLIALLWSLQHADADPQQIAELHQLSASGRTSIPVDKAMPKALYRLGGFRVCGERAVRIDILERLADIIRPLIAWKPLDPTVTPPEGAVPGGGAFTVTVAMTSLLGCSGEDFASILKSLGYRVEKRKLPKPAPRPVRLEPAAVAAAAHAEAAAAASASAEASETTEAATDASEAPAEIVATIEAAPETPVAIEASETTPAAEANAEAPAVETEASAEAAAPAEEAAATSDAPAEPPTEPELLEVDVWRPGRFERGDHQHRGPRRDERRDDRRPPREPNAAQRRASKPRSATAAARRVKAVVRRAIAPAWRSAARRASRPAGSGRPWWWARWRFRWWPWRRSPIRPRQAEAPGEAARSEFALRRARRTEGVDGAEAEAGEVTGRREDVR
ncbi:helicase-related protein [Methyloraptor flagellatus]|uniref:Helicase-related protein n=1 Tax=Methyloraptor flagellatus TaxID=3162530 RepID=A0AAU7XBV5_9HYPH